MSLDNESWIINAGDSVIEKRATSPNAVIGPLEQLIYCLWVADYGMRNAGDLCAASELHAPFHEEAQRLASDLSLPATLAAFSLSRDEFEARYFDFFDGICAELRSAQAKMA